MKQYVPCTTCNGSSKKARWFWGTKDCPSCKGKGVVLKTITKAPPRVAYVTPTRRRVEQVTPSIASASDDGDIVAGVALMVNALSSDRGSTVESQPEEVPFKGGGGEGGGAGASGSWDKPEERTAEPESVAETITASEPSEPASEPSAPESSSSPDMGSADNT